MIQKKKNVYKVNNAKILKLVIKLSHFCLFLSPPCIIKKQGLRAVKFAPNSCTLPFLNEWEQVQGNGASKLEKLPPVLALFVLRVLCLEQAKQFL